MQKGTIIVLKIIQITKANTTSKIVLEVFAIAKIWRLFVLVFSGAGEFYLPEFETFLVILSNNA